MITAPHTATTEHGCGDHLDIRDADIDTVTGVTHWHLSCALCGHRWTQTADNFTQHPPPDATYLVDPGWEEPT